MSHMFIKTRPRPKPGAFSLVEVAMALGVVAFALIGVLGAMPLAMTSGRTSIEQTRATALAASLYTSFRSQPFGKVCYADAQFNADGVTPQDAPSPVALNLFTAAAGGGSPAATFYASIVDIPSEAGTISTKPGDPGSGTTSDPRRVNYTVARQTNSTYKIELRFNNQPDGQSMIGIANRVEITVVPLDSIQDSTSAAYHPYRFSSIITNRSGSAYGATSS